MATITATKAPVRAKGVTGYPQTVVLMLDLATSASSGLADGDIITGLPIPAGATITGWRLNFDELDTNASPTGTIHIGDAADADRFAASIALGGGSTSYRFDETSAGVAPSLASSVVDTGIGYTYTSGGTIIITVATALATAATTGQLVLAVDYTDNAY